MKREQIIAEIKRTAALNGGIPLGVRRFFTETGIRDTDWSGKYWLRWSDALKEAGFTPNDFTEGFPDDVLLDRLAEYVRELGHFPIPSAITKNDPFLLTKSDPHREQDLARANDCS